MTSSNFSEKEEIAQSTPAATLLLSRNEASTEQNATLNLHPTTLKALDDAAKLARIPVLDFVFDAAWTRARELLHQQNRSRPTAQRPNAPTAEQPD